MNIVSIFAGRTPNINILKKYLDKALELNIIQQVHFWNFTREQFDEDYLKTISNLKRTSSSDNADYILITPVIINNSFEINVKAPSNICIKVCDETLNDIYEIILGENNNISYIKYNNKNISKLYKNNIVNSNSYINYKISINKSILNISTDNENIFNLNINKNMEINKIYFKTGNGSVGDLMYKSSKNDGYYFMDTCEKKIWKNYYQYYNNPEFIDDIIIKSDDDIVFIDLNKFPKYIEYIKNNNEYDIVFANIINNGISAYYQQKKYYLIPYNINNFEKPDFGGSLWRSGRLATKLHNYFLENYQKFINYKYQNENEIIELTNRYSINFFGYKGKNWHKIADCYHDDEFNLTVKYREELNFKNVIYCDFYVSHLSFYKQVGKGIDIGSLRCKYNEFFNKLEKTGRFNLIKEKLDPKPSMQINDPESCSFPKVI